jgi:hypothetical protein
VAPKFVPVIVTDVPARADEGDKLVIVGVARTVKEEPLVSTPLAWTTTFPVVAPLGTGTAMLVALQLVGVDAVPLNCTVLVPRVAPKFDPLIVTEVPTAPDVGDSPLMLGVARTVNAFPFVLIPLALTTTFPVVAPLGIGTIMLRALQLVGVAIVPLKATVLVPCDAPKLVPAMVIEAPTAPEVGVRLVIVGVANTVKLTPLLATLETVTTTFPVVVPVGTGAAMAVSLQLVGVAVLPLNFNVLVP